MSLPTVPPREAIRKAVLIRLGINREGNTPSRIADAVNEGIRSAHTRLYKKHTWARRRIVFSKDIVQNKSPLNVPDSTVPQNIECVWVESEDGLQKCEVLYRVPSVAERASAADIEQNEEHTSPPAIWWIEDGDMHISPYPITSEWPIIFIQYLERELPVAEDGDFIQVDEEMLVLYSQRATMVNMGEDTSLVDSEIRDYTDDLRANSRPSKTVSLDMGAGSISHGRQTIHNQITGSHGNVSRGSGGYYRDGLYWPNGAP